MNNENNGHSQSTQDQLNQSREFAYRAFSPDSEPPVPKEQAKKNQTTQRGSLGDQEREAENSPSSQPPI